MAKVRPIAASGQKFAPFRPGPPKFPPPNKLFAERPFIEKVLANNGVPERDIQDLTQDVLITAWEKIRASEYRPPERSRPRVALQRWLYRFAWRAASHYRERGMFSREDLHEEPAHLVSSTWVLLPESRYVARAHLRAIADLGEDNVSVLALDTVAAALEYARTMRVTLSTVYRRRAAMFEALNFDPADHLWWA